MRKIQGLCPLVVSSIAASSWLAPTALAANAQDPGRWSFYGRVRSAIELYDSAQTGPFGVVNGSDARLGFVGKREDFVGIIEVSTETSTQSHDGGGGTDGTSLGAIRKAYVGYEPAECGYFKGHLGRVRVGGAERWGSDLVTRNSDDKYGSIDGLRLIGDFGPQGDVGIVYGNSLGSYGVGQPDASMSPDAFAPGSINGAKTGRALVVYARGEWSGVKGQLWFANEKNYFASSPTTGPTGSSVGGVLYQKVQRIEGSLGYGEDDVGFGLWYNRTYYLQPKRATTNDSGRITTTAADDLAPFWRDQVGVGVGWDSVSVVQRKRADQAAYFAGLSVEKARTATDKGTSTAEAQEDQRDTVTTSLSGGWHKSGFSTSLTLADLKAKGRIFPDAKGNLASKSSRFIGYAAMSFEL